MARKPAALPSTNFWVTGGSFVTGDQEIFTGLTLGGNDGFYGEDCTYGYTAIGDAVEMHNNSVGGKDYFLGGQHVGIPALALEGIFYGEDLSCLPAVVFAGDAIAMFDSSNGGADEIHGGQNSTNVLIGDALEEMLQNARGGNDSIFGGNLYLEGGGGNSTLDAVNVIAGDSYAFGDLYLGPRAGVQHALSSTTDAARGGADELHGGIVYADWCADGYALNAIAGDAVLMGGVSTGGADKIYGGDAHGNHDGYGAAINALAGDGFLMGDATVGGNDTITGGMAGGENGGDGYAINLMSGDGLLMGSAAHAGNDVMFGGGASAGEDSHAETFNLLAGDAFYVDGPVTFGNDKLTGGSGDGSHGSVLNAMYGDIGSLSGVPVWAPGASAFTSATQDLSALTSLNGLLASNSSTVGGFTLHLGNDTITGGNYAENWMYGDASDLYYGMTGGNDRIVAGDSTSENYLIGDAEYMHGGSRGGNDTLVSGTGNDEMWGDGMYSDGGVGGQDKFVFAPNPGDDVIYDFHTADRDKIDLSGFGGSGAFASFNALMASGRVHYSSTGMVGTDCSEPGVVIDLSTPGHDGAVLIVGLTVDQLTSKSFLF